MAEGPTRTESTDVEQDEGRQAGGAETVDEIHRAYVALGGNDAAPIPVSRIACYLLPEVGDEIDQDEALGVGANSWVARSVATPIEFEERHGRMRTTGTGSDLAIAEWEPTRTEPVLSLSRAANLIS